MARRAGWRREPQHPQDHRRRLARTSARREAVTSGSVASYRGAMSLHDQSVVQMSKMLRGLLAWLDAGVTLAETKKFDPETLLQARLAPDQYPLLRQVQSACDAAKSAAARLAGVEVPSHPDTETTLDEIRQRVQKTLGFLETITPQQTDGAEDRPIGLPFLDGKTIEAAHYLTDLAVPNFYFHVTTAYAILRHNGVNLGKRDFIGSLRLLE